jgi:uncharacterized protein (TIGR02646 family)
MIALTFNANLSAVSLQHLKSKQDVIDAIADFAGRSDRAKISWNGKTGSNAGKAAFREIKERLLEMGVGTEICNYCEQNEGTDIEHIEPKDWFPAKTFKWENYLLACRTCNTDHKNNKMAVFDGNDVRMDVSAEPLNDDILLINPRREDPMDFLWLNIQRGVFVAHPDLLQELRSIQKAEYTIELLGLNLRNTLIESRKSAALYYLDRLERYANIKETTTFDEIEAATNPLTVVTRAQPLQVEKDRILQDVKQSIISYAHPTVWRELIRQREDLPRTNALFARVPEALAW